MSGIPELEKQLAQSERLRANTEYIIASAAKVNEVAEQLKTIEETGIAPLQKALDEIQLLKQSQMQRHELLLELRQVAEQVVARDKELIELEKEVLRKISSRFDKE